MLAKEQYNEAIQFGQKHIVVSQYQEQCCFYLATLYSIVQDLSQVHPVANQNISQIPYYALYRSFPNWSGFFI